MYPTLCRVLVSHSLRACVIKNQMNQLEFPPFPGFPDSEHCDQMREWRQLFLRTVGSVWYTLGLWVYCGQRWISWALAAQAMTSAQTANRTASNRGRWPRWALTPVIIRHHFWWKRSLLLLMWSCSFTITDFLVFRPHWIIDKLSHTSCYGIWYLQTSRFQHLKPLGF